ncbi:hypothetical protein [Bacillus infantis]|uniref:hypothetical protein n=1 Tax=Bacillus infantis TaxID=324767 RepID=UPI003CF59236
MRIRTKTKGFNQLSNELKKLQQNAKELEGKQNIPLPELFPDSFMANNTRFSSIQEMFDKSPFKVESEEDFAAIPDAEWDKYVVENTNFSSWENMQEAGVKEWTAKKLGL